MTFFQAMHRVWQALVAGLLLGALFWIWTERERGRPVVDVVAMWNANDWKVPEPLTQANGVVTKVMEENVVQLRDDQGVLWNVGLEGLAGVYGDGRDPVRRRFAATTKSNLTEQIQGQTVTIGWSLVQPNRTGLGFVYLGTNHQSLAVQKVADGRLRWDPAKTRVLPLREQAALRAADRLARQGRRGLWALPGADPGS